MRGVWKNLKGNSVYTCGWLGYWLVIREGESRKRGEGTGRFRRRTEEAGPVVFLKRREGSEKGCKLGGLLQRMHWCGINEITEAGCGLEKQGIKETGKRRYMIG